MLSIYRNNSSVMGIPQGAPRESLINNLVDLRSRCNFLMRLADLKQLGVWKMFDPFLLLQGISDKWSIILFRYSLSQGSEDDEVFPPTDSPGSSSGFRSPSNHSSASGLLEKSGTGFALPLLPPAKTSGTKPTSAIYNSKDWTLSYKKVWDCFKK